MIKDVAIPEGREYLEEVFRAEADFAKFQRF